MIAAWMLSVVVLGTLLLAAAVGADAVCARVGRPRRWVWAAAMVAMCVVPFVPRPTPFASFAFIATASPVADPAVDGADARAARPVADDAPAATIAVGTRDGAPTVATPRSAPVRRFEPVADRNVFIVDPRSSLRRLDPMLATAWIVLSLALASLVTAAAVRLARSRRRWTRADAATHAAVARDAGAPVPVWRSADLGPAAFGLRTRQVVIPDWVDELPATERTLLLAHEASHVRAHDPQLLAGALALVVLLPWHLPLLVVYRHLCRAVEHDCDARVLARHRDVRSYGRLLVRTAEWVTARRDAWCGSFAARWILAPVPAFAAPASELESRLRALMARRGGWRARVGAVIAGGGSLAALLVACAVPTPETGRVERTDTTAAITADAVDGTARTAADAPSADDVPAWYRDVVRYMDDDTVPRSRFRAALDTGLRANLRRHVPDALEPIGLPNAFVWLVLGPTGDAIAHATGRAGLAVDDASPESGRNAPRATERTPVANLTLDADAWRTKFPTLAVAPDAYGWRTLRVGLREVNVLWALAAPPNAAVATRPPSENILGYTPPRTRLEFQRVMADDRLRDAHLQAAIAELHPEVVAPDRRDTRFAWVVLDSVGRALAIDTGRTGLGRRTSGLRTLMPTLPRATDDTPLDELVVDRQAFDAKFPYVRIADGVSWRGTAIGPARLNILWAIGHRS